jgi:hypothetical protein
MPFLAPSFARLPPLAFLLADQTESRKNIARHLGVSLRTLQRYAATGNAPPAVYLALWFESSWGLGTLHAHAYKRSPARPRLGRSAGARMRAPARCHPRL